MRRTTPAKPSEPVEPAPGANLRTSSPNQKGDVK